MLGSIATGILGQVVLVASGVVLARALGPENRGVLGLLFVLSAISIQLGSLGVPVSLTYWIAAKQLNPRSLLRGLRGFRTVQMVATLAANAGLILLVLAPKSPAGFLWVALLSLAATAAGLSQLYGLAILQGAGRILAFNSLRLLNGILYAVGVVGLWVLDRATLAPVTLVVIGASVVATGATWVVVLRATSEAPATNRVPTRRSVVFGLRSLIGSSSPVETFRLDQLLIGLVLPPVALGYYIVGLAFTNLTRFIGQSIGMITYPRVAAAADVGSHRRIIRRDFALGAAVCGGLTVTLIFAAPAALPFFFGSEFEPAVAAAQILLVASFSASLRRILVEGTRGSGSAMWGTAAELLTLVALLPVVLVARYTDSVTSVALVVAGAHLVGLLAIAPALIGGGSGWGGSRGRRPHEPETTDWSPQRGREGSASGGAEQLVGRRFCWSPTTLGGPR